MTPVEGEDDAGSKGASLKGSAARRGACPVDDEWRTLVEGDDDAGSEVTAREGSAVRRGTGPVVDEWRTPVEGEDVTGSVDTSLKRSAARRGTGPVDDEVKTSVKGGGRDWVAVPPMEVVLVIKLTAPVAWLTEGMVGIDAAASSC